MQFHVDGELVDAAAATLPVDDRGVTFGDAVTEPVRVAGGAPVAWQAHVDRLLDTCDALGIGSAERRSADDRAQSGDSRLAAVDLRARVDETIAANGFDDALVRLTVTRGQGGDTSTLSDAARLRPPVDADPTVVVTADPISPDRDPIRLQTVRTRAIPPTAVPVAAATHNRLDAVRAGAELRRAAPPDDDPADEALVLDDDGHVVGGTASDPLFVADDALRVPALGDYAPRTATRPLVLDIARSEGFPVVEGAYTPADVRAADEAFVAEPSAGVRPVARIDGVDVGAGPVSRLLAGLFDERFGGLT